MIVHGVSIRVEPVHGRASATFRVVLRSSGIRAIGPATTRTLAEQAAERIEGTLENAARRAS